MQVPTRRADKLPRQKLDPSLTEDKFNELKDRLVRLKASHPALSTEVKRLAEMGDFSENAGYQLAKSRLRGLNQRMLDIEDRLKNAVIIETPADNMTVCLGHHVTIKNDAGREKTYLILGSAETDPTRGVISHNSPLGAALIGRRVGDRIKIPLAGREAEFEVTEIK